MVYLILLCMIAFPALGGYYLIRGKAKSLDRLKEQVHDDIRNRLLSMDVLGNIVDGPALETLRGQMSLVPSQAPASMVIDVAKFSAKTALEGSMTVVRAEDAKKVIATKNLRPVATDPAVAERYHVLASEEEFGRRCTSTSVVEKLRALETEVRARVRVQIVHGSLTILAFRGLKKPEELRAFYNGSVAFLDALEATR
jgi:hypothetical protein